MTQLRQGYEEFVVRDAEVVVIGPESKKAFKRHWRRENLPFVGVPDPEHTVADLYGQQVKLLKLGRLPAMTVIDKQGVIQYRHYGESMRDIPDNVEILELLDELNGRRE